MSYRRGHVTGQKRERRARQQELDALEAMGERIQTGFEHLSPEELLAEIQRPFWQENHLQARMR